MIKSYTIKVIRGKPFIIIYDGFSEIIRPLTRSEQDEKDTFINQNVMERLLNKKEGLMELLMSNKKEIKLDAEILGFAQLLLLIFGVGSVGDKKFIAALYGAGAANVFALFSVLPRLKSNIEAHKNNRKELEIINIAIEMFESLFNDQQLTTQNQVYDYSIGEQWLVDDTNYAYEERLSVATEARMKMRRSPIKNIYHKL